MIPISKGSENEGSTEVFMSKLQMAALDHYFISIIKVKFLIENIK